MRWILLVLLIALFSASGISGNENVGPINAPVKAFKQQERNAIDDVIRSVLESIRVIMINGTDTIPPLDPFFIENLLVNFTSADAQLLLQIDTTWVTHLAEFVIENISTNLVRFTLEMELSLPIFDIDGHYAMDGKVMNLFPLYGAGNYYVHVFNVTLGGGAGLTPGVPPQIKNLHLDFTFQSLEVKFENLLGGGSIESVIETVINDLAKQVVDSVWAIVSVPFCKLIEDSINEALANMGGENY